MWFTNYVSILHRLTVLALAIALFPSALFAQAPSPDPPAQPSAPESPDGAQPGDSSQQPAPVPSPTPEATRITPAQLQELTQSLDDILAFANKETGLPIL